MRRKTARMVATAILPMFLYGCNTLRPERLATPREVFPDNEKISTEGVPEDSFKKASYDAASDDVFRALLNALTREELNIEHQDKEKGIIIAMKEPDYGMGKRRHSVAVVLEKKSARGTDVTVYSKVQTSCWSPSPVGLVFMSIGTLFLLTPLLLARVSECSKLAELQWATKEVSSTGMLTNILRKTRENLMNAGLL